MVMMRESERMHGDDLDLQFSGRAARDPYEVHVEHVRPVSTLREGR